jgi:hypothetical protein
MKRQNIKGKENILKITKLEVTPDTLTSRGGLLLFWRYISNIGILTQFEKFFSGLRKSKKGVGIVGLFKQLLCFFYDGTSRHLTFFDQLKNDEGYAGILEEEPSDLVSSHQLKRFFNLFSNFCSNLFRLILKRLFLFRLHLLKPEIIELMLDTMVMNNDEALKRQGVEPTYKKVKGFHPLHLIWCGKIVDAIFRGGKKSGNYGDVVLNMVRELVDLIRRKYSASVPIILRCDGGFFDEKNFEGFDKLNIGFICGGKMYESVKNYVKSSDKSDWRIYENGRDGWEYIEFGWRCACWNRFYRTFYTRPFYLDHQRIFEFARPDNVIITNLGINKEVFCGLADGDQRVEELISGAGIIKSHHQRGADELPHRGLKDFGFEELPFKRFSCNTAFYYCMVIAFFLFEIFKEDVLSVAGVIDVKSYATTVRRKVLDFAGKIVKTGGRAILKVSESVMNGLKLSDLWSRCQSPPVLLL